MSEIAPKGRGRMCVARRWAGKKRVENYVPTDLKREIMTKDNAAAVVAVPKPGPKVRKVEK